nr:immunoglobulin light chain junction region [Macaca mulatta]
DYHCTSYAGSSIWVF